MCQTRRDCLFCKERSPHTNMLRYKVGMLRASKGLIFCDKIKYVMRSTHLARSPATRLFVDMCGTDAYCDRHH